MDTGIQLYAPYTSSRRYACFDCRVCFHKTPYSGATHECPTCRKPMLYAGSAFRSPPKRDVKEWAKLEVLIRAGVLFHYCGGNGQIKGLRVADALAYRRRVTSEQQSTIGTLPLIIRRPGDGKRIPTKSWYGWDSYHIPEGKA